VADNEKRGRVLLLTTTTGYQTRSFVEAAEKLGLEVVFGSDRCRMLEDPWQDQALPLKFEDAEGSAQKIVFYAKDHPLDAIVALGDRPTPTAARACAALGLLHHPPETADACRDKYLSREKLRTAGLNVPRYERFSLKEDPREVFARKWTHFPCVLKPTGLSGSRGVIRANDREGAVAAWERIRKLLQSSEVRVLREETSNFIQVEEYVAGEEIAVEGLLDRGRLRMLAIFDKPDPLSGPFFEETIYVTPSRLPKEQQEEVGRVLLAACRALGLQHGPIHAELRLNERGVWPLEIAARSIGGLCSKALRFRIPLVAEAMSLEEVLIRLALGTGVERIFREHAAAGVMMIPIPRAGFYEGVSGEAEALEVPGVEEIQITAAPQQKLVPLPEGASYLGFIFARAQTPDEVIAALRAAHAKLEFKIGADIPVIR
jgi:biotin carboxylase